ncbi:carboxylate-amine ligase [Amaricoccus macauensis]|uniref:carboxylate-amine ligase n=1 Tax=Amaricoccus macauensis TaxID=57001 RepID=UPI003C79E5DB
MDKPSLTLGIEEEYLIVDRETRDLVAEPDPAYLEACGEVLGERVTPEFLQCQIEVGTRPHRTVADAVDELRGLRKGVTETAAPFGYAVIAASTHPFAQWRQQSHTKKERYEGLWSDIGGPAWRLLICGMHMHVGIEDPDMRIDLMNQAAYFLPHLLALSGSSPFWDGTDTQLSSYRLTVFDAMPRTGLPDPLYSHSEFVRLVQHLESAGCIEDGSKIWWDIRPSAKFPTLEQRITDVCPRLSDVAALAALYQALLSWLYRLRTRNRRWRIYPNTLIRENRWRAQRYGVEGELIDHGCGKSVPVSDLVEELIEMMAEDADALGSTTELLGLRQIVQEGTSAVRQRKVYAQAMEEGAGTPAALRAVVDHLIEEFTAH